MILDAPDGKYLPEALRGKTMATNGGRKYTPCPYLRDEDGITILAHYPDGSGALAVREFGQWTSAYAAVPALPREFLEALVERAGIHRYLTTPDQVWATGNIIGVCVDAPGTRAIRLPPDHRGLIMRDLLSGEEFAADAQNGVQIEFAEGTTRVFEICVKEAPASRPADAND